MTAHTGINARRSIRLCGYDYSQDGAYFVTICTKNRACVFGEVVDGVMQLSAQGEIAAECWLAIAKHFPQVTVDWFVVMPNHVHGILLLSQEAATALGGATRAQPAAPLQEEIRGSGGGMGGRQEALRGPGGATQAQPAAPLQEEIRGSGGGMGGRQEALRGPGGATRAQPAAPLQVPLPASSPAISPVAGRVAPRSLGAIVRAFKSAVTKRLHDVGLAQGPVWQRNYFEHILRDDDSLRRCREYILDNPAKWSFDRENPRHLLARTPPV